MSSHGDVGFILQDDTKLQLFNKVKNMLLSRMKHNQQKCRSVVSHREDAGSQEDVKEI